MTTLAGTHSTDLAISQAANGGLSLTELEKFLYEMRTSPAWRARADMECDYYDSNQHTPDEIARAERLGLPVVTVNLIFATINMILGMEAKTRTDWKIMPDGPTTPAIVADAMTVKMVEAERVTGADKACSDAYASQMKAGVGWVEVGHNLDPFMYRHKVEYVDRREIWWDMKGRKDDTTDWRWLVRRKWHDADHLKAFLPPKLGNTNLHELVDTVCSHEAPWDNSRMTVALPLEQDGMITRDWNENVHDEWRDSERMRALVYEVWYRVWQRGYILNLPDGRVVEYNERDPVHLAAAATGISLPVSAVYSKVRLAWWLGPFRLFDRPSPFKHRYFPYVPFFAYREDKTRVPYGQIRVMMSLQDEINARRSKMLWQLSSSRTRVKRSAFADHDQARQEINRPDAYMILEDEGLNRNKGIDEMLKIDDHAGLNAQQMEVYRDSVQMINSAAGVYGPMLGDANAGAEAGVAIDMLIQQGTTTLAEPNDNYRTGRMLVGEQLLANTTDEMAKAKRPVPVTLPQNHATRPGQRITLMNPTVAKPEEGGYEYLDNDVTRMKMRVALADVPSSPTYMQQQFKLMTDVMNGLPDELKAIVIDMWVQLSNAPNKEEIAARLRKATGQVGPAPDPATMDPQQLAIAEQEQRDAQSQSAMQQQMGQLEMMGQAAEVADKMASAKSKEAATIVALTKAGNIKGKVADMINHPQMKGAVVVDVQPPPPPVVVDANGRPKPGQGGQGQGGRAIPKKAGAPAGQPGDGRGGQRRPPTGNSSAKTDRDSTTLIQR